MLFQYEYKIAIPKLKSNKSKAIMLAKKMLPEYVFDTAQMENKTWNLLLTDVANDNFCISKDYFHKINKCIAKNEAIYSGGFRNGSVGIAGTLIYQAPNHKDLDAIFEHELPIILADFPPIEQAIRLFLWAKLNQFYWDGNKRTARIIANGILLSAGIGIFNVKTRDILELNTLMVKFYDYHEADEIVRFLYEKAIETLAE